MVLEKSHLITWSNYNKIRQTYSTVRSQREQVKYSTVKKENVNLFVEMFY